MIKKNISMITSHPAPYMDVIFEQLSLKYNLDVYYNHSKSKDKSWKNQNYTKGKHVGNFKESVEGLYKILKSDFVIVGGWSYKFNIILIFLLIVFNKKFAVTSDVPEVNRINTIKRVIKTNIFKLIPYFFLTGHSCKEHYMSYYNISEEKIKIFPYGIIFPNKKEIKEINKKRKNDILNQNSKIKILIANRFIKRKGYEVIEECFKRLKELDLLSELEITIIGNGELYEKYKTIFYEISKEIKLLGWVEIDEYEKLLNNCDIYIHASLFEPYGIPIIDAMTRGKLVIASSGVMSAVDFISNDYNGFIYNSNTPNELSKILITLIKNKKKIYLIGDHAFNCDFNDFRNYDKVVREALSDGH